MSCRRPALPCGCLKYHPEVDSVSVDARTGTDRHDRALPCLQTRWLSCDENIARLRRRDLHRQDHFSDVAVSPDVDRSCGFVYSAFGWIAAVLALVVIPFCGYVAIVFFEELDKSVAGVRVLTFFLVRRRFFVRLLAERKAIRNEIIALGKETPIAQ